MNFEGGYPQLVKLVNLLDRSPRFLIIESLQIARRQRARSDSVTFKLNAFVRDKPGARFVKLGADQKNKVVILGVLLASWLVVALHECLSRRFRSGARTCANRHAGCGEQPAVAAPAATPLPDTRRRTTAAVHAAAKSSSARASARPEDRPDPATIDPTLRLDLLAKVQNVEPDGAMRNIFQYGAAAPPPRAPIALPKDVPKIAINKPPVTAPPPPPGPPPAPKAPPMTFKYYGYQISKTDGRKEAFLLDGDDIIIAGENETVKSGRYKVVKIGVNSITIEDTQFKSEQTLQLQVDASA